MSNNKIEKHHLSKALLEYLSSLASPEGGQEYLDDRLAPIERNVRLNTSDLREAEDRIQANENNITEIKGALTALDTETVLQNLEKITTDYNSLFNEGENTIALGKLDPTVREGIAEIAALSEQVSTLTETITESGDANASNLSELNTALTALSNELSTYKESAGAAAAGLGERIQSLEDWKTEEMNKDPLISMGNLNSELKQYIQKIDELDALKNTIENLKGSISSLLDMTKTVTQGQYLSVIKQEIATKPLVNRVDIAKTEREFNSLKEGKRRSIYYDGKVYSGSEIAPEVNEGELTEEELAEWNRQKEAGFYYTANEEGLLSEELNSSFIWDENSMRLYFNENGNLSILPVNTSANDTQSSEEFSLLANETRDYEIEDPILRDAKVFVLDDDEESATYQKWINAEGVCTLAFGSHALTIKNDTENNLTIKVVYYGGRLNNVDTENP